MKKLVLVLVGLLILTVSPALGRSFTGKVVKVADGDTITVLHDQQTTRVRLSEIDCPETAHGKNKPAQPFGMAAKRFVLDKAAQKIVTINVITTDRYGRTIGEVILPSGQSLNRELVKVGLAWWYRAYSKDPKLGFLEQDARMAKRGLWSEPGAVPPWQWRRGHRTPQ